MSSQPRISREEERRLNVRTLAIASVASACAALLTSQFWAGGTPIAAAVTPVIVAIVSEMLHRPTEKIVQRFTVETEALPDPARQAPPRPSPPPTPRSVYRQPQKRDFGWRGIAVTALLAFAIGALILTVPELIAGESIGKGRGSTSYFGGDGSKGDEPGQEEQQEQPTAPQQPEEQPATTPTTPTVPAEPPPTTTTPTQTAPSTQTTPAPAPAPRSGAGRP